MNRYKMNQVRELLTYFRDNDPDRFDYENVLNSSCLNKDIALSIESLHRREGTLHEKANACGTIGCVAGWTIVLSDKEIPPLSEVFTIELARRELDLTIEDSEFLFCPRVRSGVDQDYPDYISKNFEDFSYQDYDHSTLNKAAIQEAIDRIDYLLNRLRPDYKDISNGTPTT